MNIPTVYLLCGLPGSGKTTYAKVLENEDIIRLSLDEELFKLFGREFPSNQYEDLERKTKEKLIVQMIMLLREGKSVILDWGFWKKKERDEIRDLVQGQEIEVRLIYFKKKFIDLAKAVENRDLYNNHQIDLDMLKKFVIQFEEPVGENEEVI